MLPIKVSNHAIGIIMKELVRRAIGEIRAQRTSFEATAKDGYGGGDMDDVFTSADKAAQDIYQRGLEECLPGAGLIGEEGLRIPCMLDGVNAYFTIDPLDGTKAFVRRQSHGTATMIALVIDGKVAAAYVGDLNTQEIYGYRPGSNKVHRILEFGTSQYLHTGDFAQDISQGYAFLRDPITADTPGIVSESVSLFRNHEVSGSSIGTWMARLWKGEVLMGIMGPAHQTPWDDTPINGISRKLGFVYLRARDDGTWEKYEPEIVDEVKARLHWTAVIHESNLGQLTGGLVRT